MIVAINSFHKISLLFLMSALLALFSFSCGDTKQSTTSTILGASGLVDLQERLIKIAVSNDYVPLNFTELGSSKGIGLEYDAIKEIAERLNAKLEFELVSWDIMLAHVASGKVDMGMSGIDINDERKRVVDFSHPYLVLEQHMLTRSDESRFSDASSFAANEKLIVGSQTGTRAFSVAVESFFAGNEQNPRIKLFSSFDAIIKALLAREVDLVVLNGPSSQGYLSAYPDKVKLVGQALLREELGFVFPKGHELKPIIDSAILALKEDGSLDELSTRWFYGYRKNNSLDN